jgi:hypothetical protein
MEQKVGIGPSSEPTEEDAAEQEEDAAEQGEG